MGSAAAGGEAFDQASRHGRCENRVTASGRLPDGGDNVFPGHVLEQKAAGSHAHRGVDIVIEVERGEHEHADLLIRTHAEDALGRLESIQAGHTNIEQEHVRQLTRGEFNRLLSALGRGWLDACSAIGFGSSLLRRTCPQQAGSDAAVVALFRLSHAMSNTDGFSGAGMVASVSALIWLTRLLPAPIAWFGVLDALYHGGTGLVVQLLLTGTIYGITGPISLLFSIPWILAIGITLLVKPVWAPRSRHTLQPTAGT